MKRFWLTILILSTCLVSLGVDNPNQKKRPTKILRPEDLNANNVEKVFRYYDDLINTVESGVPRQVVNVINGMGGISPIADTSGGDITAVTAGTGLIGGGATEAVAVSLDTTFAATKSYVVNNYNKKISIRYREHYNSMADAVCNGDSIPDSGIIYGQPAITDTVEPRVYTQWSRWWPHAYDNNNTIATNAAVLVGSNTHIILPEDYKIVARKPATLDMNHSIMPFCVFLIKDADNVIIEGGTLEGHPFDGDSTTWNEGDHLIMIWNSTNVTIRNMNVLNAGCDCIDISGSCSNILVENCNMQMKNLTGARNATCWCDFGSGLSWTDDGGFGTLGNWTGSNATAALSTEQIASGSHSMKVSQTGANGYAHSSIAFDATDDYKFNFYVYAASGHGSGDPKLYIGSSPGASDIETITFDGRDYWQLKTSHYFTKGLADVVYLSFCPSAGDNDAVAYIDDMTGQDKELIGRHSISIDPSELNKAKNITFRSCVSRANGRGTCDLETYNGYGAVIDGVTFDDFKFKPPYDDVLANGNFDSNATAWSGAGWTWEGGGMRHVSGSTALTQSISLTAGETYFFGCTMSDKKAGYAWVGIVGLDTVLVEWGGKFSTWKTAPSTGTYTFSLWPWSSFDGKIDNCFVRKATDSGGAGLQMQIAAGDSLKNLRFINCEFDSLANWAIYSNAGSQTGYENIVFENCSFTNNGIGLFLTLMNGMTVNNCQFINNRWGVSFEQNAIATNMAFTNNLFKSNTDRSLNFWSTGAETFENITITGNTFDGNVTALGIGGLDGFTVKDNYFSNNTTGIYMNSHTTNGIVENNIGISNTTDVSNINYATNTVYGVNKLAVDGRQVIGSSFVGTDPGSLDAIMTESAIIFPGYRDVFNFVTAGAKIAGVKRAGWAAVPYNAIQTCDLAFSTLGATPGDADDTVQRQRIYNVGNIRFGPEPERPDYDVEITNRTVDGDDEATSLRLGAHWVGTTASANHQVTSRNELLSSGYRDVLDNTIGAKMVFQNVAHGGSGWGYNSYQVGDILWYTLNQLPGDIDDTTLKMALNHDGFFSVGLSDIYSAKSLITSNAGVRGDTLIAETEVKADTIRSDHDIKMKMTGVINIERTGSYALSDMIYLKNSTAASKIAIVGNKSELFYWNSASGNYGDIRAGSYKSQANGTAAVDSIDADHLDGYDSSYFLAKADSGAVSGYATPYYVNYRATVAQWNASKLHGYNISSSAPSASQVLQYNGSQWAPATLSAGGDIEGVTAGWGISGGGTSGTVTVTADTAAGKLATTYDLTAKQAVADTSTKDATRYWVGQQNYLTAETGDIAGVTVSAPLTGGGNTGSVTIGADTSMGGSHLATQSYVLTRGFLQAETGDISAVSVNAPLAGGGSSGAVTISADTTMGGSHLATQNYVLSKGYLQNETGDISSVTAGTWITGGGNSGAVTVGVDTSKAASITDLAAGLATKVGLTGNETIAGAKTFSETIVSGKTAPGDGIDLKGNSAVGIRDIWHDEPAGRDFYIVNMDTLKSIIFRVKNAAYGSLDWFWISADSTIKMGNYPGGNYVKIGPDGTIRLVGNATTWEDTQVPSLAVKTGATAPALTGGFGGDADLALYYFAGTATNDQVWFTVQMPHKWKQGSTIYPHVHWSPTTDVAAGSDTTVWELKYSWADINETFNTGTTITCKGVGGANAQWDHKLANFAGITGTDHTISSVLVCRLRRLQDNNSDVYAASAAFLGFDIHYEVDSLGSDTEFTKN